MLTDNSSTNWDNPLCCSQLWHCQGWEHFIITRAKRRSYLRILNWLCLFGEQFVTNYSNLSGTYSLIFISLLCVERTGSIVVWPGSLPPGLLAIGSWGVKWGMCCSDLWLLQDTLGMSARPWASWSLFLLSQWPQRISESCTFESQKPLNKIWRQYHWQSHMESNLNAHC